MDQKLIYGHSVCLFINYFMAKPLMQIVEQRLNLNTMYRYQLIQKKFDNNFPLKLNK